MLALPHGAKKGTIAFLLERLDRHIWQGSTCLLERLKTCIKVYERELEAQRRRESFKKASTGRYNFSSDAIARDKA